MPLLQSPVSAKKLTTSPVGFPPAWLWLVDELVPTFVKANYSPRDSWKDKPFTAEDVRFFVKGVRELSDIFTEDRPGKMPAYFLHPKFRSAYLLYFLPLQMAKFITVFRLHPAAIEAALEHGRETGVMRVADLGAGPGTASIGLLLHLLATKGEIPPIELLWLDTQKGIMEDGKKLVEMIATQFPRLRDRVTVKLVNAPWWRAPEFLNQDTSLLLLGHVLNEAPEPPKGSNRNASLEEDDFNSEAGLAPVWKKLLNRAQGGGILMVEPASKRTSQHLSQIRDQLFASETIPGDASSIWGPCLHAGRCPLAQGRDWCHFSVPVDVPGKWFRSISKALSSERHWLKFSYLWLAAPEGDEDQRAPIPDPQIRRVISDPLARSGEVLTCEPDSPARAKPCDETPLWRGDLALLQTRGTRSRPENGRSKFIKARPAKK